MGFRVVRKDHGLNALKRKVAKVAAQTQAITLGIHGDTGSYEGASVVEVATYHEFGMGVPERSFVRAWVDEKRDAIDKALRQGAGQVALGKLEGTQMLEQMGALFKASMQARISAGIAPPLSPSTIARKGSATPLIDTGVLKASIDYKVL